MALADLDLVFILRKCKAFISVSA